MAGTRAEELQQGVDLDLSLAGFPKWRLYEYHTHDSEETHLLWCKLTYKQSGNRNKLISVFCHINYSLLFFHSIDMGVYFMEGMYNMRKV